MVSATDGSSGRVPMLSPSEFQHTPRALRGPIGCFTEKAPTARSTCRRSADLGTPFTHFVAHMGLHRRPQRQ
eukprot:8503458-Pyramimonas_sp.AAC.1